MPSYTGNRGCIGIDNYSYSVSNWSISTNVNSLDITKQAETGSESRSFISDGLRNGVANIEFDLLEESEAALEENIWDCLLSDDFSTFHFEGIVTSSGHAVTVGDKVTMTFDFQILGEVTQIAHAYNLEVDDIRHNAGTTYDIDLIWNPRYDAVATDEQEIWIRSNTGTWSVWTKNIGELAHNLGSQTRSINFDGLSAIQLAIRVKETVSGKTSEKSNVVTIYDNDLPTP